MSFGSVLRNRGFRALWIAQAVSKFGDSVHEIALIYLVYRTTGDPALVGAVVVASAAPLALVSPVAGVVVDRVNRKPVLIGTELLRGGSVLAIPLAAGTPYLVPVVLAVAGFAGLMEALFGPARESVVPQLVDDAELDAANGLSQTTKSVAKLLYAAGGVVIALVGPFNAFLVDSATFLVSAAVLVAVPRDACRPTADGAEPAGLLTPDSVRADIGDAVAFVRTQPVVRTLLVLSGATALILGPLGVVIPFFAESTVSATGQTTPTLFGWLYSAIYAGVLAGGMGVGGVDSSLSDHRGPVIVGGVLLVSTGLLAVGSVGAVSTAVAAVCLAVVGVGVAVVQVPTSSLVQVVVPNDRRGRVVSLLQIPATVAPPIGAALAGPLVARFGPSLVLLAEGAALSGLAVALRFSTLWRVGESEVGDTAGEVPGWLRAAAVAVFVAAGTTLLIAVRQGLGVGWLAPVPYLAAAGAAGGLTGVFAVAVEALRDRHGVGRVATVAGPVIAAVLATVLYAGLTAVAGVRPPEAPTLAAAAVAGVGLAFLTVRGALPGRS